MSVNVPAPVPRALACTLALLVVAAVVGGVSLLLALVAEALT